MADSGTVELRLLGTIDALVDGGEVSLGGPRRRRLLLALALAGRQVVSDEALVEAVWPEVVDRPGDPINTVHQYVSRLRGLIGAAAIETAAPGYRLAEAVRLDIDRLEAVYSQARALASRGDISGAPPRVRARGERLRRRRPHAAGDHQRRVRPTLANRR